MDYSTSSAEERRDAGQETFDGSQHFGFRLHSTSQFAAPVASYSAFRISNFPPYADRTSWQIQRPHPRVYQTRLEREFFRGIRGNKNCGTISLACRYSLSSSQPSFLNHPPQRKELNGTSIENCDFSSPRLDSRVRIWYRNSQVNPRIG